MFVVYVYESLLFFSTFLFLKRAAPCGLLPVRTSIVCPMTTAGLRLLGDPTNQIISNSKTTTLLFTLHVPDASPKPDPKAGQEPSVKGARRTPTHVTVPSSNIFRSCAYSPSKPRNNGAKKYAFSLEPSNSEICTLHEKKNTAHDPGGGQYGSREKRHRPSHYCHVCRT